jgi:NAD(P)-dependent dehydrogenase (short-subunit alcohol dehydrogenase family)
VKISGKVALVTGSSRGIGRQIARELAAKGARVAVHYRADREAAQETLASLGGGPHAVFGADVADAGSARGLVEGVAREMGGIDVLVNNAGVFEAHPILEVDYRGWQDAWSRTIATNLIGPANLSFLAVRIMIRRARGERLLTRGLSWGTRDPGLRGEQGRPERDEPVHGPGASPARRLLLHRRTRLRRDRHGGIPAERSSGG